jgi:hypothetical protein
MKMIKINRTYVFKHTMHPESRWFGGEFSDLEDARTMGFSTDGLLKLAGKRFVVKDVQTYLKDVSIFLYVPDLNVSLDYFWSYLQDHTGDVVNCNRVWSDLILTV